MKNKKETKYAGGKKLSSTETYEGAIRLETPDAAKTPIWGPLPENKTIFVSGTNSNLNGNYVFYISEGLLIVGHESNDKEMNIMGALKKY